MKKKKREQLSSQVSNVRKGMCRFVVLGIDMSRSVDQKDFQPSRLDHIKAAVEKFILDFFDQNPLSQLSLVFGKNAVAEVVSEMSGHARKHLEIFLKKSDESSGEFSLQNILKLSHEALKFTPPYGTREVIIICSSLTTCDPGDILETIDHIEKNKIRCSIIGIGAEVFIFKKLCEKTKGKYNVSLNPNHFQELLSSFFKSTITNN